MTKGQFCFIGLVCLISLGWFWLVWFNGFHDWINHDILALSTIFNSYYIGQWDMSNFFTISTWPCAPCLPRSPWPNSIATSTTHTLSTKSTMFIISRRCGPSCSVWSGLIRLQTKIFTAQKNIYWEGGTLHILCRWREQLGWGHCTPSKHFLYT